MPWYQFTLRSLLLFTLFVAVLCTIGVRTHWLISAGIALPVVVGRIAGRIVAGTQLGFGAGVLYGSAFLVGAVVILPFLCETASGFFVTVGIAALFGGVVGGLSVRPRSGQ
jgi:hypothetical protein